MRLIIVVSFIILLIVRPNEAQVAKKFGVLAAFTQTQFQTSLSSDFYDDRSGVCFAVNMQVLNSNIFALVPQIEYRQKGLVEIMPAYAGDDSKSDTRLDYISIPIFLRLHYSQYNIIPYLKIGPRLDILINKDIGKFTIGQRVIPATLGRDFTDFVFGGSISEGIEVSKHLPLDLFIEFRYNRDITNTLPNRSIDATFDAYNPGLVLWFHYQKFFSTI